MSGHDPTRMKLANSYPKVSQPHGRFKGGTNYWIAVMRCPACDAVRHLLRNTIGNRELHCDGERQRFVRAEGKDRT